MNIPIVNSNEIDSLPLDVQTHARDVHALIIQINTLLNTVAMPLPVVLNALLSVIDAAYTHYHLEGVGANVLTGIADRLRQQAATRATAH